MKACSCANPKCMEFGCQIIATAKLAEVPRAAPTSWPEVAWPVPQEPHPKLRYVPQPLTEEDVRRIIREELARAKP